MERMGIIKLGLLSGIAFLWLLSSSTGANAGGFDGRFFEANVVAFDAKATAD